MQNGILFTRSSKSWEKTPIDFIILEAGDGRLQDRRNPVLAEQWETARGLDVPVGLHYTIDSSWYQAQGYKFNDWSKWTTKTNDPSMKDLSWALGTVGKGNVKFLVLTAMKNNEQPGAAWLYNAMQFVIDMAWKEWKIPYWIEFIHSYIVDTQWDDGGVGRVYLDNQKSCISMRQVKTASIQNFETFGLTTREGSLWRYGDGAGGVKLYQYYGNDFNQVVGFTPTSVVPPVVPPETPPVVPPEVVMDGTLGAYIKQMAEDLALLRRHLGA